MNNPWLQLPASRPFVLADDKSRLDEFNAAIKDDAWRIRLDSLPEPFLGRPDAKVVLLNLNPGFSEDEVKFHLDDYFTTVALKNLAHELQDYPFYFLDPAQKSPGHLWWQARLGSLISRYGHKHLANEVFCVEFFPYHSKRFNYDSPEISSQQYGFSLVRRAINEGRVIVVMRAERLWLSALPELTNHNYYALKNPRAVYVSPGNAGDGFLAICKALDES